MIFNKKKDMRLFVAGPVNLATDLKKYNPFPEIGHREPEFETLFLGVKDKLHKVFKVSKDDFDFAILGGSGTSAIECMISSVVNKKILVISNGTFGERAYEIARIYRLPRIYLRYDWGEFPKTEDIEKILTDNPDIGFVYMVHMETSTGMLNPVKDVGQLCKKHKKTYLVDSVCAIGGEKLDMNEYNIDFCAFSSNKGIGGPAVIGMICCRKSKLLNLHKRNMYLNLESYLKYGKRGQTPFTPAIHMLYLMNETLSDFLNEGVEARLKRHAQNCKLLNKELSKLGLTFYLRAHSASSISIVYLPKGITFEYLHDELKKRGFLIYACKGELNSKAFHVATMGALTESDVNDFIKNLKVVLK